MRANKENLFFPKGLPRYVKRNEKVLISKATRKECPPWRHYHWSINLREGRWCGHDPAQTLHPSAHRWIDAPNSGVALRRGVSSRARTSRSFSCKAIPARRTASADLRLAPFFSGCLVPIAIRSGFYSRV